METTYDHYIAVDWSIKNMAIARMTGKSNKINVIDVPSDVRELKLYVQSLRGTKVMTIEETTTAQWLYTELRDQVDRLVMCDPVRNRLLSEGAKNDRIDAMKLVQLLRGNLLKEVYHSSEAFMALRKLVSGYEDVIRAGVRLKNQRYALLRGSGLSGEERGSVQLRTVAEQMVLRGIEQQLEVNEQEKAKYVQEFQRLSKQHVEIRHQKGLPGIGLIGAVKIVARVVTAHRFPDARHYVSYAGLIQLERKSGGVVYGRKQPRYSRELKSVYKTGVLAALGSKNVINDYYEYLIHEKSYPEHQARHKAARKLAMLSYGVFRSGNPYQPKEHGREVNKDIR